MQQALGATDFLARCIHRGGYDLVRAVLQAHPSPTRERDALLQILLIAVNVQRVHRHAVHGQNNLVCGIVLDENLGSVDTGNECFHRINEGQPGVGSSQPCRVKFFGARRVDVEVAHAGLRRYRIGFRLCRHDGGRRPRLPRPRRGNLRSCLFNYLIVFNNLWITGDHQARRPAHVKRQTQRRQAAHFVVGTLELRHGLQRHIHSRRALQFKRQRLVPLAAGVAGAEHQHVVVDFRLGNSGTVHARTALHIGQALGQGDGHRHIAHGGGNALQLQRRLHTAFRGRHQQAMSSLIGAAALAGVAHVKIGTP